MLRRRSPTGTATSASAQLRAVTARADKLSVDLDTAHTLPTARGGNKTVATLDQLLAIGPAIEVAGRGEFARRGGIVDCFPPSAELPVRIEFFGDEIDSLRRFDPTDQRTVGPAEASVEIVPPPAEKQAEG